MACPIEQLVGGSRQSVNSRLQDTPAILLDFYGLYSLCEFHFGFSLGLQAQNSSFELVLS